MYIRTFGFFLCLLLCVCSFFGIYRLQAAPQPQETQPRPAEVSETQSDVGSASPLKSDVKSDFTQTILKNNLFAPLGTVLNRKPVPGANLQLMATVVRTEAAGSTALITNRTTGRQHVLAIGDVLGAYSVTEIQPKQVRLSENGNTVILRLPQDVLLN